MSEIKSNTQETDEIVKKTIQKKSVPKKKVVKKVDEDKSNETLEDNDNKEELIKKSVPKKTVSRKKVVKKDDEEDKSSENLEEPEKTKTVRRKVVKKKDTETEVDLSYLRVQTDECIFKMEVENKKKIKSEILSLIDEAHNILYNQENIEGENALNDIMNFMFIEFLRPILSDKEEEGKIDLLNPKHYVDKDGNQLFEKEYLIKILSYFKDLTNLCDAPFDVIRNFNETTDAIRQMGEILKTHPVTKQIYSEDNFINAKKPQTILILLKEVILQIYDNLFKLNLSKLDLSKVDLSKINLSKIDLKKVDLSNVSFTKEDLINEDFIKINLPNLNLLKIDLDIKDLKIYFSKENFIKLCLLKVYFSREYFYDFKLFEFDEDIIGEIYEHIINKYVKTGSKLGQFFTPRPMMKLMFNYKNARINEIISKIKPNEKIKLCDTCMGTGGWLVTGFNMLKEKYGDRLLLSGGEVKPSTFQYGLMNLILTLHEFPHIVQCESSLTHIDKEKHHLVLTNPPFQTDKKFDTIVKNFKTDEYTKKNKVKLNDVYVLQDNNPPIQFLELDLYKLEDNGLCIIILPYGELFFGSSHQFSRSYFMKNANVTDIVLFEGGTFTHTGIKTCALIFEKDKTGTKAINFIKANKECSQLTLITTVTIDDINKEPVNSWYLRDYLKDEYIENLATKLTNFQWIEFKDIFTLEKGQSQSSKVIEDENGDGVMVTQSKNSNDYKKIIDWKIDGQNLFIGNIDSGRKFCIIYYDGKCDYTNLLSLCKVNDNFKNKINIKYIYYYLKSLHDHLTNIYLKGSCNLSLDQNNFNRMKIPIPSLEDQEKIIINITKLEELIILNTKSFESNDEMLKIYINTMIKNSTNFQLIEFKEIFTLEKGQLQSSKVIEDENGDILFVSKSELNENTRKINNSKYYDNGLFIANAFNGNGKCPIRFTEEKCIHSDLMSKININDKYKDKISLKYVYYFLNSIKSHIETIYEKGSCNRSLDQKNFNRMKILVPILEYQKKIEETLNMLDELKQYYKDMIVKINENIEKAFMNSLDDYGNPNGFNLDKILLQSENEASNLKEDLNIDEEKEEPIKIIKKKKVKTDK